MASQQGSPAVARWRVRAALRKAREAKGLTQGEVADAIGWSLSKVQRIEAGDVNVSSTDLRAALDLFGVTEQPTIQRLQEYARIARRERWVTSADYREHLTPAYLELLQFEAEATAIRNFQTYLVPAPMQTPAYAAAVIEFYDQSLTDDERRVRLEVRLERRRLLDDKHYLAILDESLLKRQIGGPEVYVGQLNALVETAERPNVNIRILPFAEGGLLGMIGPFQLLNLGDDDVDDVDEAILYRETYTRDNLLHDPVDVRFHRTMFERMWARSLDDEMSIKEIRLAAAALQSQIDRN